MTPDTSTADTPSTGAPPSLQRLQAAVLAMPMARTLGLRFVHAAPGAVTLEMPILESFCFRPGQLQATAVYALGDFAAVAAAGSLLPPGWANATVDGTVKLFAPARGACLRARGRVVDAGRLLSICAADVLAVDASGTETLCATWLGTARNLEPRPVA
ncbi:MAG: PaaI family thioesterase [Acidovorax sp.]|jgi:acyl-coenzyme A thioesterase PaaI-like protein|uniref:PaaI family thioesterase n=2 Tax=unclassified Acidovorax TaxID=2684926 RepID=UPI002625F55C|nr:PaaI family thioesterase [Acidovorax sp.]MDH4417786.1 PaaI family thioesterase [Acidovorax sp.]